MKKHMAQHEDSGLAALKHDFEEALRAMKAIAEANETMKAENAKLRGEIEEVRNAGHTAAEQEMARIEANIPQQMEAARKTFEAEEQVTYTAGPDGVSHTINGYKVYIAPFETKQIPKSFVMAFKRNAQRAKTAAEKSALLVRIGNGEFRDVDGTLDRINQVLAS